MDHLLDEIEHFAQKYKFKTKGPLSVALHITRWAITHGLPIDQDALLADSGGQVVGLGRASIQNILKDYGITRVLAEEGGRTSRGSIGKAAKYSMFLNKLNENDVVPLAEIEAWWVQQVIALFATSPFELKYDGSKSLRSILGDVLNQADRRQKENPGTQYAGAVLQHLIGAKLELAMPMGTVTHHGASVSDDSSARSGDFVIADASIHCTTAPSERLLEKCVRNLEANRKPIIVTVAKGVAVAEGLAENKGIADRIEILEATQFIAGNLHELGLFTRTGSRTKTTELIEVYN